MVFCSSRKKNCHCQVQRPKFSRPSPPTSRGKVGGPDCGTFPSGRPWVRKNTVWVDGLHCLGWFCCILCVDPASMAYVQTESGSSSVHRDWTNKVSLLLTDNYVDEYAVFVFCPEGTSKMMENAVSKVSRAKVFIKYLTLGWPTLDHWTWQFLYNIPLLKS